MIGIDDEYFNYNTILSSEVAPVWITLPDLKSKSRTKVSAEAVANKSPLGFHRTQLIGPIN